MLTIYICDDNFHFASELENLIHLYFANGTTEYKIGIFTNGTTFLEEAKKFAVDIVFMDILLEKECGIDISRELRAISELEDTAIIYVSSIEMYTKELIRTRPTEYINKPVQFKDLKEVLDACQLRLKRRRTSITVIHDRNRSNIRISDILYIESLGRTCTIVTGKGKVVCYAKLSDLHRQIGKPSFLEIHKSFVVNFDHVQSYSYDEVVLNDGKVLGISQTRRKKVRESYLAYSQGEAK